MAGHQLPFLSLLIPTYMVKCMCSWRQTLAVWPALLVAGGSFAVFQYLFATFHDHFDAVIYPMTDIGGGMFSLIATAIFLQFWKPSDEWHFDRRSTPLPDGEANNGPLTARSIAVAWTPFVVMSVLLVLTGIVREKEGKRDELMERDGTIEKRGPIYVPDTPIETNLLFEVPTLHHQVQRDERLRPVGKKEHTESAVYNFAWLTTPGSAVLAAAVLSSLLLRPTPSQLGRVLRRTVLQMKIPIPTIAFMLGLSYVTRYAGMDATLGVAFAHTGALYPFFAAILGWLGVFLTGTDAGSNALFGSLQRITADQVFPDVTPTGPGLSQARAEILICTANSTGGVMGKMIDAQSICVATAATHQLGKEADIFKAVIWHSIILAAIVGVMTLLQAYVYPFTLMVPSP
jgi:lactate permease